MSEMWKEIGFGYEVSSVGLVRNRQGGNLRPRSNQSGYLCVNLWNGEKYAARYVAGLVATTFIGPRPFGLQINHINGVKTDNRVENLEYVTCAENNRHAFSIGLKVPTVLRGEDNGRSVLRAMDVGEIRRRHMNGEMQSVLAEEFGVSRKQVWSIVHGLRWAEARRVLGEKP